MTEPAVVERYELLTNAVFKEILESHPGVTKLKRKTIPCDGFMASKFSFKRQREGTVPRCKLHATYAFDHLRSHHHWSISGRMRTPRPPTQHYCWQHLIYRGVFGGMDEEARTERWLNRRGYETGFMRRNRIRHEEKLT